MTPLMVACHGGHTDCMGYLLERKVNVNALAQVLCCSCSKAHGSLLHGLLCFWLCKCFGVWGN